MHAQGLNVALSQNNHISMRLANGNEDCTKGMVVDLLFVMGSVTVRCQVYVVDNTPWPVLLGRPFTCLLEAVTLIIRTAPKTSSSQTHAPASKCSCQGTSATRVMALRQQQLRVLDYRPRDTCAAISA
jgi:hypothetical protein